MTSVDHNAAACRATKHTRVQHLITADEHSLAELEALIATLPLCSTGRVFIEVPDDTWPTDLAVPPRMIVTWRDRSSHCLLYTSPSPRDRTRSRMPSSA